MKNSILNILFVGVLIIASSMSLVAQNLLKDPHWDHANQGKDAVCNRIFESQLKRNLYSKKHFSTKYDYYAVGYLKNIDFYYVSYMETQELAADITTELFKIHPQTDISSFDYAKTSIMRDDPNKDHRVVFDIGKVDSFEDYLVIYHPMHVAVYKKSQTDNSYNKISDTRVHPGDEKEYAYDPTTRKITRKTVGLKGDQKGLSETFQIVNGKMVKIK